LRAITSRSGCAVGHRCIRPECGPGPLCKIVPPKAALQNCRVAIHKHKGKVTHLPLVRITRCPAGLIASPRNDNEIVMSASTPAVLGSRVGPQLASTPEPHLKPVEESLSYLLRKWRRFQTIYGGIRLKRRVAQVRRGASANFFSRHKSFAGGEIRGNLRDFCSQGTWKPWTHRSTQLPSSETRSSAFSRSNMAEFLESSEEPHYSQ